MMLGTGLRTRHMAAVMQSAEPVTRVERPHPTGPPVTTETTLEITVAGTVYRKWVFGRSSFDDTDAYFE